MTAAVCTVLQYLKDCVVFVYVYKCYKTFKSCDIDVESI